MDTVDMSELDMVLGLTFKEYKEAQLLRDANTPMQAIADVYTNGDANRLQELLTLLEGNEANANDFMKAIVGWHFKPRVAYAHTKGFEHMRGIRQYLVMLDDDHYLLELWKDDPESQKAYSDHFKVTTWTSTVPGTLDVLRQWYGEYTGKLPRPK